MWSRTCVLTSSRALSLSWLQALRLVVLPQAVRISIAPTVGFLVQLIKGTSVTALIGFLEVTRAGQLVSNVTLQPFTVYSVVALLYVLLCWPLSFASQRLEAGLAISTRRTPGARRMIHQPHGGIPCSEDCFSRPAFSACWSLAPRSPAPRRKASTTF